MAVAAAAAAAAALRRPIIVGGLGTGDANNCGPARLGGGILFVDGTIYASSPDNVWAIDARDGTVLWHYYWKTRGGTSLQTRGLGMWKNYVYFELHDDWVVCLNAKNGKEVWKKEIASFDAQYFSSNAPMVLGNHVIVGTGNDMDAPGYIKSFDPETGELQWTFYTVPMNAGDPGARHLGQPRRGAPRRRHDLDSRLVRSRDQALHFRHRQSDARVHRPAAARATTCTPARWSRSTSIPARWRGITRPLRTTRTTGIPPRRRSSPICRSTDGTRKLVITATRNGYFFVLDRVTGEHLVTSKVRPREQLGVGSGREGPAEAQSEQGRHDSRFPRQQRCDELSASHVLAGYRACSTCTSRTRCASAT